MQLLSTLIPSRRDGRLGSADCGMVLEVILVSTIHSISAKWGIGFARALKRGKKGEGGDTRWVAALRDPSVTSPLVAREQMCVSGILLPGCTPTPTPHTLTGSRGKCLTEWVHTPSP